MVLPCFEFISCSYLHSNHFHFHSELALGLAFAVWKVVRSVTLWKFPYFFVQAKGGAFSLTLNFSELVLFLFHFCILFVIVGTLSLQFSLPLLAGCSLIHFTSAFVALMMRKKQHPSSALQVLVGPSAGFFAWKHRTIPVVQRADYAKNQFYLMKTVSDASQ